MSDLLDERERTHGKFVLTAFLTQQFKEVVRLGLEQRPDPDGISWAQIECLEAICLKMARIISGDPNFPDHWRDIRGYASDRLVGLENGNARETP